MTVSAPLIAPVTLGLNCTPRVQVLLASTLLPHGIPPPEVEMKSPLATTLLMATAVGRLLVTVITDTALVDPTVTLPKLIDVGVSVISSNPVPEAFWI